MLSFPIVVRKSGGNYRLLVIIFSIMLSGCSKTTSTEYEYDSSRINSIYIDAASWNVNVNSTNDENISIEVNGASESVNITEESDKLSISQSDDKEDYIALGNSGVINIYLPNSNNSTFSLTNGDGEVSIKDVKLSSLIINNNSGVQKLSDIETASADIKTKGGDMYIENSSISSLSATSSSGYYTLTNNVSQKIDIETKSGEIKVDKFYEIENASITTDSGDITIIYQSTPGSLDVSASSGSKDVSVKLQGLTFKTETSDTKSGLIGNGSNKLAVQSNSGTIIIK